ncbi:HAMP domain-containing histidine kinase [Chitinophaga horti]|uniref:histidine kinase n=1 Tax=Chitinophaga horti TaxID=2920382 RepID=A0ABY6JA49_9BACT|nr:HAMP domain-containing sensor histidine kinase [Chitinophaga horti]UYQ95437.1 HAMP domain-containing histidine kinase [Chitinophaga horti]
MNLVEKRIWWMVVPTVLAVMVFQGIWLRSAYRDQRQTLSVQLQDALRAAYDEAFAARMDRKPELPAPPKDTACKNCATVTTGIVINSSSEGRNTLTYERQWPTDTFHAASKLPPFLSAVLSSSPEYRPDTAALRGAYTKQLSKRDLHLPFVLLYAEELLPADSGGLHVSMPFSVIAPDSHLYAYITGERGYLLQRMAGAFAASLLLLLIVAGCIWVLWRIILRQKALEAMRVNFISNITHELKTPVAILSTINEALLTYNGISDREKAERYLRLSKDEINKLEGQIDQILQLSKLENGLPAGAREQVSLQELLHAVQQRYSHLPGVTVTTSMDVHTPVIVSSHDALQTILNNLVDNAVKYTDKAEKLVRLHIKELPGKYVFTVSDNGIGVQAAHLPYLFDKFYRVPQGDIHEVKGYGLGLSHARELVQQSGGNIRVQSTPGVGSEFAFEIPAL